MILWRYLPFFILRAAGSRSPQFVVVRTQRALFFSKKETKEFFLPRKKT
jgi:hypothetical protein